MTSVLFVLLAIALLDRWGKYLVVGTLAILGLVLIADGIGWFLGYPLLPVS